jgi:predicted MFS family arabinose efflux permease
VPVEHGVTFTSVDSSVQNMALVLAPNIGGLLSAVIGTRASLLVVALLGAVAFALFAWNARPATVRSQRQAPGPDRDAADAPGEVSSAM